MHSVEKAILGCIVQEPHLIATVHGEGISPHSFTDPRNAAVYSKMLELYQGGRPIDGVVLYAELQDNSELALYSTTLVDDLPYTGNIEEYISLLKDDFLTRKLKHGLAETGALLENMEGREVLQHAERMLSELSASSYNSNFRRMADIVNKIVERIEDGEAQAFGLSTGFSAVDRILHGLHAGNLVVLASRPGMGKSAISLNVARYVAAQGRGVALISLEMSSEEIGFRTLSLETENTQDHLKEGKFGEQGWRNISKARKAIAGYPLYVEDHGNVSIMELQSNVRRLQAEHNIELVIVDYVQLMGSGQHKESRVQEVGAISRGLKLMARSMNIPILALSQLSRKCEERQDKRPLLSDLRESGNIEQDADIVLFIYRDGYYNDLPPQREIAEIIVAKNRNGRTGTVKLMWEPSLTRFQNIEDSK